MPPEPPRVEIDRARLHRAVWAKPVPKAAEALKVTSPTLRRMVEILDVPLPGQGSWMGETKPRTKPLLPREDGGPESVWLVPGRRHLVLEHDPRAAKHDAAPAAIPEGLHPIVARAARHYARPLLGTDGTMKPRTSAAPSLRVSVEQRERALAFADLLVRRLEDEGCAVSWSGPMSVETPDGKFVLLLREEVVQEERPSTPSEVERDRLRLGGPKKHFTERPTGRLVLQVRDRLYMLREQPSEWREEGERTLDKRLGEVVREMLAYQRARLDLMTKAKALQDAQACERARQVRDKRARDLEEERRKRLDAEIAAWERATTIRMYADALETAHRERHGDEVPTEVKEWVAWIRRHADRVDPTKSP